MRTVIVDPTTGCSEELSFDDLDPNLYVGYVMSQKPFEIEFSLDPIPEKPAAVLRIRSRKTQTVTCAEIDKLGHIDFDVLNADLNIPSGRRVVGAAIVDFKLNLTIQDL